MKLSEVVRACALDRAKLVDAGLLCAIDYSCLVLDKAWRMSQQFDEFTHGSSLVVFGETYSVGRGYLAPTLLSYIYTHLFAPRPAASQDAAWLKRHGMTEQAKEEWRFTAMLLFADMLESEGL